MATPESEPAKSIPLSALGLEGVNFKKCFEHAYCLKMLISGKTGVGKSALINSLVGAEICKVNDPGLEGGHMSAGTLKVEETKRNIDGIFVTIYDSPGLQDGTENDEAYLEEMHQKCNGVNLFLYCIEMTASRFTASDKKAIQLITKKFGQEFWKRCVLVLTKANMVRVQKGKEREYHERLYNTITSAFRKQLISEDVSKDIANSVPSVAAGQSNRDFEDDRFIWYVSDKAKQSDKRVDFLPQFLISCFERTANESQLKFLTATRADLRIKELPDGEASEARKEFEEKLNEMKRVQDEERKKYEKIIKANKVELEEKLEEVKKLKTEYEKWPKLPPPVNPTQIIVREPEDYDRMTRAVMLAGGGAKAGAAVGGFLGPVGAAVGGVIGGVTGFVTGISRSCTIS